MATSRTRDAVLRAATASLSAAVLVTAVRAARRRRREWRASGRYEHRSLTETLDVPADREPLYWLLRDATRVARVLDPQARVALLDGTRSQWTLTGPRGEPATWVVEIVGDVPELMVSWSVTDGPMPHHGRVQLSAAPGGTRVGARLEYTWSSELTGATGIEEEAPGRVLREALRRVCAAAAEPTAPSVRQPASRGEPVAPRGEPAAGPGEPSAQPRG